MIQTVTDFFQSDGWRQFCTWFVWAFLAATAIQPKLRQASESFADFADSTATKADDWVAHVMSVLVQALGVLLALVSAFADAFGWRRK